MNKKSLARHALKFDPFSPGIPTEAIRLAPAVEHFCWRVETQLVPDGGFALISGEPGTGKSVTLRALAERLENARDVTLGTLTHASSNLGDFYREMGDVFGVAIRSHNRWGGFKKLRERWVAHLEATHVRQVLLIDEAQEMPAAVLNELRLLSSDRFDSRSLLTVVLAGDGRLVAKLGREELLPLGSRIRVRLPFEAADTKTIGETLMHLMVAAGNPALMTEELVRTIAEHAMGNHRVAVSTAAELLAAAEAAERETLDEAFYLEVFGARGARRAKRGR